jgi:hypothetical protein
MVEWHTWQTYVPVCGQVFLGEIGVTHQILCNIAVLLPYHLSPFSGYLKSVLAIIEKRRNLDAWPAGASSRRNASGAEARRMG